MPSPHMRTHQDKVIVITGGGRGLGRAYAHRLAAEGGRIAIVDIDVSAASATAEEVRKMGFDAMFVEADVSSQQATIRMADLVIERWGQIDGLVANAGLANSVGGAT